MTMNTPAAGTAPEGYATRLVADVKVLGGAR